MTDTHAAQRWSPRPLAASNPSPDTQPERPKLPTVGELEAIRQSARDDGHAEGFAAGRNQGFAAGAAEAQAAAQRLNSLAASAAIAVRGFHEQAAHEVLEFALMVAKQMLRRALLVQPSLALAIVREAMSAAAPFGEQLQVRLHPSDLSLLRDSLRDDAAATQTNFIADPEIEIGGCVVTTRQCEVDATLSTRWQRLNAALSSNNAWLGEGEA